MRSFLILLAVVAAAPAGAQQVAASTARVYELHEVEVLPRPQNAAEFTAALAQAYPPHLREAGVGGTVQVAFVVGADGTPGEVRVVSTPDSSFSAPSVQAVSLLRFTPAQVGGQPVAVRVEQPITWRAEAAPAVVQAADAPGPPVDTTYELSAVDVLPRVSNRSVFARALAREYPPALRNAGSEGIVQVRFRVGADGTISHPTVTRVTNAAFIQPTLRAVQELRFTPARLDGRPVAVWVEQPIHWTVQGPGGLPAQTQGSEAGSRQRERPSDLLRPRVGEPAPCAGGRPC
ncbi:MAG TPA: energy transducer TonB [Longimicrobium sp.]|nr:energy transducer TonB [Longimicrobium sp.]